MLSQSKIEVWYKVSGQRILLGETCSTRQKDVISLWVDLPNDQRSSKNEGYRLSLFDDDGRHIADKSVSQSYAESILSHRPILDVCQAVNQLCFSVDNHLESNRKSKDDQADLAFI
ncbi:hypothetical protein [Vibrio sp. VB16]|uniref:hypothetical protein n=1 Tax=Vibrio sp. VB16 TaxID=2785746 RepID=UPI002F2B7724